MTLGLDFTQHEAPPRLRSELAHLALRPTAPVAAPNGNGQRPATLGRRRELFAEVVELVEREYRDDLALDDIARRLAASRRQIQRVLSEIGETNFRRLVTEARMRNARAALSNGHSSVRDVARLVGYDQAADFTKAFRRHHGMTPSVFRRQLEEQRAA